VSQYKPYPAYKDSGVEWLGRVPEHWSIVPLKWCFECLDGRRVPLNSEQRADIKGEVPYWGSGGVVDHIEKFIFDEPLVLLGEDGAPFFDRGRPVAYAIQGKSWINNHIHVLRPLMDYPITWFVHALNCVEYRHYIDGSTRDKLTQDDMKSISLVIPESSDEARKAVAHLNRETVRIDALIEKKTRFIELLREKRQALITHAVTKGLDPNVKMKDSGVGWLGEVPEHWVIKRFRDICISISTGPFGTALGNEDYVTGGVPVINPSHIVDEQCSPDPDITVSADTAERLSFWAMRAGDLVTARRGELGRAAVIFDEQDGWICGTGSLRVRPNPRQALTGYIHTVLQSRYAREWLNLASVGATMANLNESILGSLPLVLPPSTVEQERLLSSLATQSERLIKIEQKATLSVALLKERRSALITAAVTGQIDLREAV
jgi:type I restriction enzyme S subunit